MNDTHTGILASKIVQTAFLTLLTLGGSIVLTFASIILIVNSSPHVTLLGGIAGFVAQVVIPALGGGLWGWGLARLFEGNTRRLVRSGALCWGLSILLGSLALLGVNQSMHFYYDNVRNPVDIWIPFAISFSMVAGVLALINTRLMVGKLGRDDIKAKTGWWAGITAFMVFGGVVLLMHVLGWQVGGVPVRPNKMSTVVVVSHMAATLVGGAVLGWNLVRHVKTDIVEERSDNQ